MRAFIFREYTLELFLFGFLLNHFYYIIHVTRNHHSSSFHLPLHRSNSPAYSQCSLFGLQASTYRNLIGLKMDSSPANIYSYPSDILPQRLNHLDIKAAFNRDGFSSLLVNGCLEYSVTLYLKNVTNPSLLKHDHICTLC